MDVVEFRLKKKKRQMMISVEYSSDFRAVLKIEQIIRTKQAYTRSD